MATDKLRAVQKKSENSGPALVVELLLMGGNLALAMAKHKVQETLLNWLNGRPLSKRRAN